MSNIIMIMNYETEWKVQIIPFFEVLSYFLWTNYGKSWKTCIIMSDY